MERSIKTISSSRCVVMYKKTCLSLETSEVSLIVELKLFALSRKASSAALRCIRFMSMPSINLSHEMVSCYLTVEAVFF